MVLSGLIDDYANVFETMMLLLLCRLLTQCSLLYTPSTGIDVLRVYVFVYVEDEMLTGSRGVIDRWIIGRPIIGRAKNEKSKHFIAE